MKGKFGRTAAGKCGMKKVLIMIQIAIGSAN